MMVWGSGGLRGAPGEHLGAKMAPKSAKRSFMRGVDGQLGAKMDQLGSKMGSQIHRKSRKSMQKSSSFFFDEVLDRFGSKQSPKSNAEIDAKIMKKTNMRKMFRKSIFFVFYISFLGFGRY